MKVLLLLCLYFVGSVGASHFFVTAPNVLRFNHDETVLVNVFGESNFRVEIFLQIGTREFSRRVVVVRNDATPSTTTIKVTEKDLFPDEDDKKKPTEVLLKAKTSKGTFSRNLLLSYNTGYIIMHTSKPMYHPNENVRVRALAMTETMKFAKGWNISMDIISPSNLTFGRTSSVGKDKFFEDVFKLPPHAEKGLWTLRAFFRGQYRTEGRATFQVQEYVLPTFGVNVDVSEKVLLENMDVVKIKVDAKYVYKKPVNGRAILRISCLAEDEETHSLPDSISTTLEADGSKEIDVNLKELKRICGGFPALDGQRLHVSARVIEFATGHEEIGSYKQTVFSLKKYKFNFENSKKTYRPGLSYYLRVLVKLANGDDPGKLNVKGNWNLDADTKSGTTDEQGNALMFFIPSKGENKEIWFNVVVNEEKSDRLVVQVYKGNEQIQIEQVIKRGEMIIQATVQGIGNTGIMSLLLSRGRYIDHMFFEPATNPAKVIDIDIQEKMAPEARVVAFFITNNGKLVVDSTKFSLKAECRGRGLNLKTDHATYSPNDFGTLTITGSPHMGVGLNVMDKALLLLDDDNVLRKSKMFEMMRSHDLGCGEGGGSSAEQVLRDAGVTVVTNANLDANVLDRKDIQCEGQSRKKRSLDCASSKKPECCNKGLDFAMELIMNEGIDETKIDPYVICFGQSTKLSKEKTSLGDKKYSVQCLLHFLKKCLEELHGAMGGEIIAKSALDSSDAYFDALKKYNLDLDDIFVRKDFKDSWLFRNVDLDENGESDEIELKFPSSITDWMIQAIGISEDQGLCISEPKNVTAFKPFFIQLEMPYKASRLEYFEIEVTIFNYGNPKQDANVDLFISETKGLCTGVNPKEAVAEITMKANDAYSVRIPILALEAGKFPITVTAIGKSGTRSVTDAIEKELLVVNEGVEEREAITVCLNPFQDEIKTDCTSSERVIKSEMFQDVQEITVNLTLPENAIKDTGSAFAFSSSNVMDDVVKTMLSGIDNMLRKPIGCGEQTMMFLGPSVYVMSYWKNTKQITPGREIQGNQWIRDGVKRELTFRKVDGSFAAWLHRKSSTWLTAFVGKVFCQAKKVVDDAVNFDQDVVKTLSWLEGKMDKMTGSFTDDKPVSHRSMIGQINEKDPSLTAFVLITLLECDHRTNNQDRTKKKAMEYLERLAEIQYRRNPYLLAISTYALALAESKEKIRLYNLLLDNKHEDVRNNFMYWGSPGGYPAGKDSVETTSYALLALMQFPNGVQTAGPVVKWLSHQRSAAGSFRTTQDTVIGLQALSEYTIRTFSSKVKLDVTMTVRKWSRSRQLNNENRYLLETIEDIPVEMGDYVMTVKASGEGSGKLTIDYRYNRPQSDDEKCSFKISNIKIGDVKEFIGHERFGRKCDVCGICEDDNGEDDDDIANHERVPDAILPKFGRQKRNAGDDNPDKKKQHCVTFSVSSLKNRRHGMSIIDVGLETGMHVVQDDLIKMKEDNLIDSFEMPESNKGFFILYLNEITSDKQEFKFRLEDHFTGDLQSRQPTRINVYDYYNPEFECIQFYGTSPAGKSAVEYKCDSVDGNKKGTCSCLKNICPSPDMKSEIIKKAQDKEMPAQLLAEITCDFNRADFAVLMKVTSVKPDFDQQLYIASAVVVKSVHEGTDDLERNSEIDLYWRMFCDPTLLERNKTYYMIAMDGAASRTTAGNKVYQLMGSTIIVEWNDSKQRGLPKRERYLQKIMNVYEGIMRKGCGQ